MIYGTSMKAKAVIRRKHLICFDFFSFYRCFVFFVGLLVFCFVLLHFNKSILAYTLAWQHLTLSASTHIPKEYRFYARMSQSTANSVVLWMQCRVDSIDCGSARQASTSNINTFTHNNYSNKNQNKNHNGKMRFVETINKQNQTLKQHLFHKKSKEHSVLFNVHSYGAAIA